MLEPEPGGHRARVDAERQARSRGADVLAILADGRRISATTGGDGTRRGSPGCPTAQRTIYAWAPDMRPGSGDGDGQRRRGRRSTITLVPGEVASAGLESHRMTQRRDRRRRHRPRRPRQPRGLQLRGAHRDRRRATSRCQRQHVPERHLRLRRRRELPQSCVRRRAVAAASVRLPELPGRRPAAAVARDPGPHRLPEGVLPDLDGRAEPRVAGVHAARRHRLARPARRPLARADRARRSRRASRCPDIRGRRGRGHELDRARRQPRATTSRAPATPRTLDPIDLPGRARGAPGRADQGLRRVGDEDRRRHRRPLRRPLPGPRPRRHPATSRRSRSPTRALHDPGRGREGLRRRSRASAREWSAASIAPGETWFPDAAGDPDDDFIIVPRADGRRWTSPRASSRSAAGETRPSDGIDLASTRRCSPPPTRRT